MTVKVTSWESYQDILRSGVAKTQAERVLQAINYSQEPEGISRAELAKSTGLAINSVCGRVKELLDAEVIYVAGVGCCKVSGRQVELLKVISYE